MIEKLKTLIAQENMVFLRDEHSFKYEVDTIHNHLPFGIKAFIRTHFEVLGEENRLIVFKEK